MNTKIESFFDNLFDWLMSIGIIVVIIGFLFFKIMTPQSGEHTGYITAVENSGLIFKSNKLYFKTDAGSSQEDIYCFIDNKLYDLAAQYSKDRTRVTIHFKNDHFLIIKSVCNDGISIIRSIDKSEIKK